MKKLLTLFSMVTVLAFLTVTALAASQESYDSVVVGKSDLAYDVKAVQEAVDKGGTVLLKGTFNFGQKGQVNIKNDVEIMGEIHSQNKPVTKIEGGFWTFHSPLPSKESPPEAPGPKIVIHGIHFDGALYTPLYFAYTSGAEISGNKITNVIPYEIKFKWKGGDSFWWQAGAVLGTQFIAGRKVTLPGAVTGKLTFQKNSVDMQNDKPNITLGQGVYYQLTWGATIEISENVFTNVSRNSIECLDNYLDKEGRGRVTITDNKIITPTEGCPFPGPTGYPNGIVVGWFHDMSGGTDPNRNSKIVIMDNYIESSGELARAIVSIGDGTVILGNRILIKGGSKSKGIIQLGSNGFVARNKIEGSGACAMQVIPVKVLKGSGNTFAWNDVKEFKASSMDFLCVGNNNTLVGTSCKVVDKGKGNIMLTKN